MNNAYFIAVCLFTLLWIGKAFRHTGKPFRLKRPMRSSSVKEVLLNPVRGTRDFLPADLRKRSHLFEAWRESARRFTFEEYDAPIVENEELYVRKNGEEIVKQLYAFADGSGDKLALRPEMTPSLTRIIERHRENMTFPLKWYSIPQCWRYETNAKGRRREHYQWNMDIWGVAGPDAEAELLSAAVMSLELLGLTKDDIVIRISNRKLLTEVMNMLSICPEVWTSVFTVIDKLDKIGPTEVLSQLLDLDVTESKCKRLLEILQIKSLEEMATALGLASVTDSVALRELSSLLSLLSDHGLSEWVSFDPTIVRGLHYYTGTVFEAFDRAGQMRAVFGGGRYDNIVQSVDASADPLPAVGFGMGDIVLHELLTTRKLVPELSKPMIDTVVYAMEPQLKSRAYKIAHRLRSSGRSVDFTLEDGKKLKWVLQRANRLGASELIVLAPDEDQRGEYLCKDLNTGTQRYIKYEE